MDVDVDDDIGKGTETARGITVHLPRTPPPFTGPLVIGRVPVEKAELPHCVESGSARAELGKKISEMRDQRGSEHAEF